MNQILVLLLVSVSLIASQCVIDTDHEDCFYARKTLCADGSSCPSTWVSCDTCGSSIPGTACYTVDKTVPDKPVYKFNNCPDVEGDYCSLHTSAEFAGVCSQDALDYFYICEYGWSYDVCPFTENECVVTYDTLVNYGKCYATCDETGANCVYGVDLGSYETSYYTNEGCGLVTKDTATYPMCTPEGITSGYEGSYECDIASTDYIDYCYCYSGVIPEGNYEFFGCQRIYSTCDAMVTSAANSEVSCIAPEYCFDTKSCSCTNQDDGSVTIDCYEYYETPECPVDVQSLWERAEVFTDDYGNKYEKLYANCNYTTDIDGVFKEYLSDSCRPAVDWSCYCNYLDKSDPMAGGDLISYWYCTSDSYVYDTTTCFEGNSCDIDIDTGCSNLKEFCSCKKDEFSSSTSSTPTTSYYCVAVDDGINYCDPFTASGDECGTFDDATSKYSVSADLCSTDYGYCSCYFNNYVEVEVLPKDLYSVCDASYVEGSICPDVDFAWDGPEYKYDEVAYASRCITEDLTRVCGCVFPTYSGEEIKVTCADPVSEFYYSPDDTVAPTWYCEDYFYEINVCVDIIGTAPASGDKCTDTAVVFGLGYTCSKDVEYCYCDYEYTSSSCDIDNLDSCPNIWTCYTKDDAVSCSSGECCSSGVYSIDCEKTIEIEVDDSTAPDYGFDYDVRFAFLYILTKDTPIPDGLASNVVDLVFKVGGTAVFRVTLAENGDVNLNIEIFLDQATVDSLAATPEKRQTNVDRVKSFFQAQLDKLLSSKGITASGFTSSSFLRSESSTTTTTATNNGAALVSSLVALAAVIA